MLNFKKFLLQEAPMPPIPGGLGGAPLPTGGPGAGPGGPGGLGSSGLGMGGPPPKGLGGLGGLGGGGLGGPPGPLGGGLGAPADPTNQVPAKEIKATNVWEVLSQILSSSNDSQADSKSTQEVQKPLNKTYKSLKV